jgi:hypothetical protein
MSERRIVLALSHEETGTFLGALAWAIGALQIMRDRGYAEADEEFQQLYEVVSPRLEGLVERVGAGRQTGPTSPQLEQELEAAFTAVREAFETWITLTAMDTLSAAVAERLAREAEDGGEEQGTSE